MKDELGKKIMTKFVEKAQKSASKKENLKLKVIKNV